MRLAQPSSAFALCSVSTALAVISWPIDAAGSRRAIGQQLLSHLSPLSFTRPPPLRISFPLALLLASVRFLIAIVSQQGSFTLPVHAHWDIDVSFCPSRRLLFFRIIIRALLPSFLICRRPIVVAAGAAVRLTVIRSPVRTDSRQSLSVRFRLLCGVSLNVGRPDRSIARSTN